MKQRKPLKMLVPESVWHEEVLLDRPEIHELVKAHAEKLELDISDGNYYTNEEYIYIHHDGYVCTDDNNYDGYEEISWQDFLKLTPEGVEVKERKVVELSAEMQEKIGISEHTEKYFDSLPTTTDRNEKAWELFKDITCKNYVVNKKPLNIDTVKILISECLNMVDEFLKQAGNK